MQKTCTTHCSKEKPENHKGGLVSFLPGIVIALLPKCPFCVLSLTSAITVCSSKNLEAYTPHWASWISIAFAIVTMGIVAYNYKGWKTQVALLFIGAGSVLIVYSELFVGLLQPYYWGCTLVLLGVWMNASFFHFWNKIRSAARKLAGRYAHA
ncbi:MAG: hypothetical protein MUC73_01065 [Cyclobacteriaceae bacterium]|jgi:hypothetical protein|nr:hypothetical protein [Cyclobacteriaceae bacterium]